MINVINMQGYDIDCAVCGDGWSYSPRAPHYGIPIYEDEILPDDDPGERAGQTVCPRCYFVVRGMQETIKGRLLVKVVKMIATRKD